MIGVAGDGTYWPTFITNPWSLFSISSVWPPNRPELGNAKGCYSRWQERTSVENDRGRSYRCDAFVFAAKNLFRPVPGQFTPRGARS